MLGRTGLSCAFRCFAVRAISGLRRSQQRAVHTHRHGAFLAPSRGEIENTPPPFLAWDGRDRGVATLSNRRMVRTKGGILACVVLLDPKGSDASRGASIFHDVVPGAYMPAVLEDRHHRDRHHHNHNPTAMHRAGNVGLQYPRFSCRGSREGAIGCESWRNSSKATFVPSGSPAAVARGGRTGGNKSIFKRKPWRQQRLPSAEGGVTCRCGRVSTALPRRRGFMRRCRAVVSMATNNGEDQDGDAAAVGVGLSPQQQQAVEAGPFLTGTQRDGYARPEVPKWTHKAVIIPG